MRILITSGPTRQYLDPVRYLTNGSSGRMGAALAAAVLERGGTPVVVSGPVALDYPAGSELYHVVSTEEMLERCMQLFPACDGVIGAAAPCDFRPEKEAVDKLSKEEGGVNRFLRLVETPDILGALARLKRPGQWIVAFALETLAPNEALSSALRKIRKKGAALLVLNGPASIDAVSMRAVLIDAEGTILETIDDLKENVARKILGHMLS